MTQEQITEVIEDLRRQYKKKLAEIIANKTTNQKRDAQGVIELAEILEQIYVKSNQKSYINTICRQIARDFRTNGDPHWYYVYDYLENYPQYKNQNITDVYKRRREELERDISAFAETSAAGDLTTPTNSLESLRNSLENLLEDLPKDQIPDAWKILRGATTEVAEKAEEKGVPLITAPQETTWSVPDRDFEKISTVEPPKTDEEVLAILTQLRKEYHRIGDELFDEFGRFWPQNKEHVPKWAEGIKALFSIFRWINDDKYSLDVSEWFDRTTYERFHGKHAAAVWQKAQTVLCKKCSENILEDSDEYEVMVLDPESESGWRCPRCHGTDQFERAMTREQIGDRREFIFSYANYLLNKIPGYAHLVWWYRTYKKPYNTARKPRLFDELSRLA